METDLNTAIHSLSTSKSGAVFYNTWIISNLDFNYFLDLKWEMMKLHIPNFCFVNTNSKKYFSEKPSRT